MPNGRMQQEPHVKAQSNETGGLGQGVAIMARVQQCKESEDTRLRGTLG